MSHAGEAAELHALGLLDRGERALLERHVVGCPDCLRHVGAAEESAARLASALPWSEPSFELKQRLSELPQLVSSAQPFLPVAPTGVLADDDGGGRAQRMAERWVTERKRSARLLLRSYAAGVAVVALVVGLAFTLFRLAESDAKVRGDDVALSRIARSSFANVALTPASDLAPRSSVLYAKDGSWLYVLIEGDAARLRVVADDGGAPRDLGAPSARGAVAALFVENPGKPQHVALRDVSGTVASAELKY